MPRTLSAFPYKEASQAPGDKPIPFKEDKSQGDSSLKLEDTGLVAPDMNAGFPESMSDGLDRLPPDPGHTRLDPYTD